MSKDTQLAHGGLPCRVCTLNYEAITMTLSYAPSFCNFSNPLIVLRVQRSSHHPHDRRAEVSCEGPTIGEQGSLDPSCFPGGGCDSYWVDEEPGELMEGPSVPTSGHWRVKNLNKPQPWNPTPSPGSRAGGGSCGQPWVPL